jgi:protein-tyrosine phosphatase
MKLTEIIPGKLYQSAEFKNSLTTTERLSILNCYRIDVVVNVYKNHDTKLARYLYNYIYYPLSDGKKIDGNVNNIANKVAAMIKAGHKVLVHCHAGRNRSGFVNALVVMKVLRVSGKEALEIVRLHRPRAIDNINFETYLRSL